METLHAKAAELADLVWALNACIAELLNLPESETWLTPEKRADLRQMYAAGLLQRQRALDFIEGKPTPGMVLGTVEQELQNMEQVIREARSLLPVLSEAVLATRSRQQSARQQENHPST